MICFILLVALSSQTFGKGLFQKETLYSVLKELHVLKSKLTNYESKMIELDNLQARTDALENEVSNLKQTNERLQREMKKETDLETISFDEEIPYMKTPIQSNTSVEGQLRRSRFSLREMSGHRVAFTAGISSYDLHHLGEHQTIIFDKVLTNFGNAYHPHAGIFLVPFTGVYVITVTITVKPGLVQWIELVVDGSIISIISAGPAASNDYASTSQQWILQLNIGSEVLLRTDNSLLADLHGNMNTMFSGFLLFDT